ncbi:phosphotransferase [Falsirhodobacter deserti]|uniref:phosphotransferase n=1 Tax=Falsirhodobacter deserti TaxID=1365611 RepID=UPI0013E3403E|nr:phosphotransferase [Falsirhodobacter deserti]
MTVTGIELAHRAEIITPGRAAAIAQHIYGLQGRVEWLWGEKDSNYRLTLEDGQAFLLKILTPGEDPGVTAMHSAALAHVELRDPFIPVQRVIRTRTGALDARIEDRSVRLVTFLPGVTQGAGPVDDAQRHAVGALLARMQAALVDFTHPSAHHPLTWNTSLSPSLARHIPLLPPDWREEVAATLARFRDVVVPRLPHLPSQVIHNDFNRENILVDPTERSRVTGIIDFGDLCHAARLIDVGVAACYQQDTDDPVHSVLAMLEGYGPLLPEERRLLWPTIRARIAMRLLIPYWRASLFPEQADRILAKCPAAWEQLRASGQVETLP